MAILPVMASLWVAEGVVLQADARVTVVGMLGRIRARPPAYDRPLSLFAGVKGIHGTAALKLSYRDLRTGETLIRQVRTVRAASPLVTKALVWTINRLPVPHAGVYLWRLSCEGEMLAETRLHVEDE